MAKPPGGSSDTLLDNNFKGEKAQSKLEAFASKWFSANRMCLVLTSKHEIEDMQDIVINKFGYIKKCDKPLPHIENTTPIPESCFYKIINIKWDNNQRMRLSWPLLPREPEFFKSCTMDYFMFLLTNDESEVSIKKSLLEHGYIDLESQY